MEEPNQIDTDELLAEVAAIDDLLALADVTEDDIAEAVEWWNETASDTWKGVIDEAVQ
jgi:hypothetical protein